MTDAATEAIPPEIVDLGSKYRKAAGEVALAILDEGRSMAKAEEVAAVSAEYADREVAAWRLHPASPRSIACRAGCRTCCSSPIAATIPEVIRIAGAILDEWPDGAIGPLLDRLDRHAEASRGLDFPARRRLGRPCPLLDEAGRCSIHPVRPLICRGWNSLDLAACIAHADAPSAGLAIPTDPIQRTIAAAIAEGTRDGLERGGLEHRPVELVAALRIVLDDPGSVDRWLAGESPFRDAEVGEEKGDRPGN